MEQNLLNSDVKLISKTKLSYEDIIKTFSGYVNEGEPMSTQVIHLTNVKQVNEYYHHTIKTNNLETKINIIKFKKQLKNKNMFISESLTNYNYQILKEVKKLCFDKVIFSAWTKNGVTFAKKKSDSKPIPIYNLNKLTDFLKQ
jgi:hypothetical protein